MQTIHTYSEEKSNVQARFDPVLCTQQKKSCNHVKKGGGEQRRRGEETEAVNILKKVELKGSAAPVNTESLPVLRVA